MPRTRICLRISDGRVVVAKMGAPDRPVNRHYHAANARCYMYAHVKAEVLAVEEKALLRE